MSEPIDEAKAATTQTNKQPKNLQEPDRETKAVQEEAGYTWLWVKQAIIQEVIGRYKLEKGGRIDIIEMISLLEHAFLQTQQDSRNEGTEWFSQFVSQVFQELDKRYVNSVETTLSMGGVEERETPEPALPQPQQQGGERTSEELTQRFIYEDESKVPPGVDPKQLDFLRDAASIGAFEWVKKYTGEMISRYYTTEATLNDLAKEYGISVPAVRERITRGLTKMRRVLYRSKPELAQEDAYPLEQVKKGKERIEVLKSEQSRKRVSEASRNTIRRPGADIFTAKRGLR